MLFFIQIINNKVKFISAWRSFVSQKSFETKDQDYSLKKIKHVLETTR